MASILTSIPNSYIHLDPFLRWDQHINILRVPFLKDSGKYPLFIAKVMLSYLGFWPQNHSKVILIIRYIVMVNMVLMGVSHTYYMMKNITDIGIMASTCTTVSTTFQTAAKMIFIHYHSDKLEDILKIVTDEYWPANIAGTKVEKDVRYGSRLVIAMMTTYLTTAFFSCWDFMAIPLVYGERELPLQSSYPFEWKRTPLFEIMYVWQFISNQFFVINTLAAHDFFLNSLLMCCISQFKLLKAVIRKIGTQEGLQISKELNKYGYSDGPVNVRPNEREQYQYVIKCVKYHIKILKVCSTLESLYGLMVMLQFFLSAVAICVSTFVLTKFDNYLTKMLSFSSAHLQQFFFLCAIGNQIIHESVSVSDAAYESKWYNDEYPEVRRALQMIIQRASQREQKLTALGIADLDFVNFINVLRITFSFYTLLSSFKN